MLNLKWTKLNVKHHTKLKLSWPRVIWKLLLGLERKYQCETNGLKAFKLIWVILMEKLVDILSLNLFKMVCHNRVNNNCSLKFQANVLVEDIDCQQSPFCSNAKNAKKTQLAQVEVFECVSMICVTITVTLVLLSSLCSFPQISN